MLPPFQFFVGSQPDPLSTRWRDRDALVGTSRGLGVVEILKATREFSHVDYGPEADNSRSTAGDITAIVTPGQARNVEDGSRDMVLRTVQYRLAVEVSEGFADKAYEVLDRLEAVVENALLDEVQRAYGGFCLPWKSAIAVNAFESRKNPTKRRVLDGSFAYRINRRVGLSETR